MIKPLPHQPTFNQMQAQSQAQRLIDQQAYIAQAQAAQQQAGVQNVGHWSSHQTPSCSPAGATYIAYVGANGTLCYAYQGTGGTLYPYPIQGTGGASIGMVKPQPSIKIEECGVRAGEIIAYRAWKMYGNDPNLHSVYVDYIWKPDKPQQDPKGHLNDFGGNGFHAFKTLEKCKQEYGYTQGISPTLVYGEVALWGKVIEHERGYRAEYARVTRILEVVEVDKNIVDGGLKRLLGIRTIRKLHTRTIDKLRKRYGV